MPCRSDYMEPTPYEVQMSRVYQLLDYVEGSRNKFHRGSWAGYDNRVYGHILKKADADAAVKKLCDYCKSLTHTQMRNQILELQIWWRDHKLADKKRKENEQRQKKESKIREKALKKLTAKERKVLGLD